MKKKVLILLAVILCLAPILGAVYAQAQVPAAQQLGDNPRPPVQPTQDPEDPPPPPYDPDDPVNPVETAEPVVTDAPPVPNESPDLLSEYWWVLLVVGLLIILIIVMAVNGSKKRKSSGSAAAYAPPVAPPPQPVPPPVYPAPAPAPMQPTYQAPPAPMPMPMPAPTPNVQAVRLTCTKGPFAGSSYPLGGVMSIGRDPNRCQIVFPASTQGISSLHCEVSPLPTGVMLTDKGSTYGTFLANGTKLTPHAGVTLRPGDSFYLASPNVEFSIN